MITQVLYSYIADLMKQSFIPALTLSNILDKVLGGKWWEYEYDTIIAELSRAGLPTPDVHLLGEIQALAAVRTDESLVTREWHVFEKTCCALTGIPVLFYDKQNLPIENVHHTCKIINQLGGFKPSDEIVAYIGAEALNDDILWHPIKFIDDALMKTLTASSTKEELEKEGVLQLRASTEARFKELGLKNFSEMEIREDSPEDIMCMAITRSLLNEREMLAAESASLTEFHNVENGTEFPESEKTPGFKMELGQPSDFDSNVEIMLTGDGLDGPDAGEIFMEEDDIASFEDGLRQAFQADLQKLGSLMGMLGEEDPVFTHSAGAHVMHFKIGAFPNVPIETGVPFNVAYQNTSLIEDNTGPNFPEDSAGHFPDIMGPRDGKKTIKDIKKEKHEVDNLVDLFD